jgi:histidinol phosphatase-like enzyme
MSAKKYTLTDVIEKYHGLSDPFKIIVLGRALSEMQAYNGRSINYTIAQGMGYEYNNDDEETWSKKHLD